MLTRDMWHRLLPLPEVPIYFAPALTWRAMLHHTLTSRPGMKLTFHNSERAPKVYGPYSQAIVAGDMVYAAGQLPLDPTSMELVGGGIKEQGRQVLANLRAVLQGAGTDVDRVVKTTLYLTDLADFTAFNEVYAEVFGDHKPVRSTVGVAALPRGAKVEVDAIAIR